MNKLHFIIFVPEYSEDIGLMFEVINNRGKPLSELEKIKNYFIYLTYIYKLEGLRLTINKKWSNILRNLTDAEITDTDDENSFIRNVYLVYFDTNKDKSWHVYKQLKQKFNVNSFDKEKDVKVLKEFINFLEQSSEYYIYLNKRFLNDAPNILSVREKEKFKKIVKNIRCHPVRASIIPLYLSVMCKTLDWNKKNIFLDILEKLNFRIYLLPKITSRSDTFQGFLFNLANDFYHNRVLTDEKPSERKNSLENLNLILKDFTIKRSKVENLIRHLTIDEDEETEDYYHMKGIRYLLAKYEESLHEKDSRIWDIENILIKRNEGKVNDYLSLEHIWAKQEKSHEDDTNFIEKRRLVNFVLYELGKNISQSNSPVVDKINEIKKLKSIKGHSLLFQVNKLISNFDDSVKFLENDRGYERKTKNYYIELSKKMNDLRETELIKFVLSNWIFEGEDPSLFDRVDSFVEKKTNSKYVLK